MQVSQRPTKQKKNGFWATTINTFSEIIGYNPKVEF